MLRRSLRLFKCHYCAHRLRFGATQCGSCYQPVPLFNRTPVWILIGVAAISLTVSLLA